MNSSDFQIRKLDVNDEEKLFNFLHQQDLSDANLYTRLRGIIGSEDKLRKFSHDECSIKEIEGERIIALYSEEISGLGLLDYFNNPEKKHVALVGIIVDKKIRGKGLGKKLLSKIVDIGIQKNIHKFRANVHEHNVSSMKMVKSLGFKEEGKFIDEEFDGQFHNVVSLALFTKDHH